MIYLIFNLCFLCLIGLAIYLKGCWVLSASVLRTLFVLLILTAIFDSVLIKAGLFHYNISKLLGVYVGAAPIEDFFYPILAAIMVPAIWRYTKTNDDE